MSTRLFALGACLVAPFVGSFIGVVIERLPTGRSIVEPPSSCDHCGHGLRVRDLIPLLSWLSTGGRCRYCDQRLGSFYPLVELAAIGVVLVAWAATGSEPIAIVGISIGLGWILLTLAWIDARWLILPDVLSVPLIPAGLIVAWLLEAPLIDHLLGAAIGFLALVLVAVAYRRLRGRDGMGLGDAKLMAGAGAWLSWQALPSILLVAALTGLVIAFVGGSRGDLPASQTAIPFGPPLAAAFWCAWLFGPISII